MVNLKKITKEELEEREKAKIEALRLFKEEQARLVEEERKQRENVWRQKWKEMHEGHVASLDSPLKYKKVLTPSELKRQKKIK